MSRDAASFDDLYRRDPDPWDYETSAYEADKYARCLALLHRSRYRRALDVGCSTGVMSAAIAAKCDSLLGLDFAPTAVARARSRNLANARFEVAAVPADWPAGQWDLIVLSEVLYYLTLDELDRVAGHVVQSLSPGGTCLVAGYTGPTDTDLTASGVEDRLIRHLCAARRPHRVRRATGSTWIASVFECRSAQTLG